MDLYTRHATDHIERRAVRRAVQEEHNLLERQRLSTLEGLRYVRARSKEHEHRTVGIVLRSALLALVALLTAVFSWKLLRQMLPLSLVLPLWLIVAAFIVHLLLHLLAQTMLSLNDVEREIIDKEHRLSADAEQFERRLRRLNQSPVRYVYEMDRR
jgi:hypothetical protein